MSPPVSVIPFIIVDGYNLLHKIRAGRQLSGPGNLRRARFAMIQTIAGHFSPNEQVRLTIVFDAAEPIEVDPSGRSESEGHQITILYASEFDSADTLISELLRKHSAPRQVIVVSSDRQVQQHARRRKASFVDSLEWFEQLPNRQTDVAEPHERPHDPIEALRNQPLDDEEKRFWLQEFGIDEDD